MMEKVCVYLSRNQSKITSGMSFADVYAQYLVPTKDRSNAKEWTMKENVMRVFDKTLQVESKDQMGWLLYSFDALDLKHLG